MCVYLNMLNNFGLQAKCLKLFLLSLKLKRDLMLMPSILEFTQTIFHMLVTVAILEILMAL